MQSRKRSGCTAREENVAGIAGIIGKGATAEKVNGMLETVRHRGPGSTTVQAVPGGVVGIAEMRPSTSAASREVENGPPVVLLDGVLYNRRLDSSSGTAVLRELYKGQGTGCFPELDGSFACAVADGSQVIIARDGVGARPLVYGTGPDGTFYFASEAKALRAFVEEVQELPPARCFSSVTGLESFRPFSPPVPEFDGPEEAARVLRELVIQAVERAMSGGEVGGVSLSGGLDSSIVLAVARDLDPRIKAFSSTIKDHPGEDLAYARLMAREADVELYVYELTDEDIAEVIPTSIWHLESFDEDCVSGFVANYYTSRLASRFTDCVLVGEGADELFGGYFRELASISEPAEQERVARKLLEVAYNTALRRLDRAWTANSVEYRPPFLDAAVAAFSNKIPLDLKVYAAEHAAETPVEKWILREAFRDLLPAEIADRPKLRFARGVGVDSLMDRAVAGKVSQQEFASAPQAERGLRLNSPKELHFYKLFRECFPAGYEGLTVRWDPFK